MVCIYCGAQTQVYNSRLQHKINKVWRRRRCLSCGAQFSTVEGVDLTTSLLVTSKNKPPERFSRDKLFLSLYNACKHRKDAQTDATALTDTVLSKLLPKITDASLSRQAIVSTATAILKRFDKAAGVQYAAFHPV